ncbi:MAG: 30S ribosomal protein S6 [Candidatus Atribacteria bacterium]|nr:30S ribosomal protein S6 [Candidatus Atribacteria bacterium]
MNNYELGVIFRPTLSEEELNSEVEKLKAFLGEKGEVVKVDLWGRRKLAYSVQKYQEGYYVFFNFKISPSQVTEVKRWISLNEKIIRHLLVKEDEREEVSASSSSPEEEIKEEVESEETTGDASSQS